MSTINDTDAFLVNRGNQSYKVNTENLMATIQDDDLMLVNRSDRTYKITGKDVKDSIDTNSPPSITSVLLYEQSDLGINRFNTQSFVTEVTGDLGEPEAITGIKATLDATIANILKTSDITTVGSVTGTWTNATAAALQWGQAAYGASQWVAVAKSTIGGSSGATSTDGVTWTASTTVPDAFAIAYNDGYFVSIDGADSFVSTDDGATWTAYNGVAPNCQWKKLSYGNGLFVAVADQGSSRAVVSDDNGATWTIGNLDSTKEWKDVAFGNGKFIAVGINGGYIAESTDGINWTGILNSAGANFTGIAYGNGIWVATAPDGSGSKMSTDNGATWSNSSISKYNWQGIAYGGGVFVAVQTSWPSDQTAGQLVAWSTDAVTWNYDNISSWTSSSSLLSQVWVNYGNTGFLATTTGGYIRHNTTGGATNPLLTFIDDTNLALFESGDPIRQDDDAASGTAAIIDVAAKTIQVSESSGTWTTGNYVIGPNKGTIRTQMFCNLDQNLQVKDLQTTDPGFITYTGDKPTITFPLVLPNGEVVDDVLLEGSSIYTTIQYNNLVFPEVTKDSNIVTPSATCVAGPIETSPIASVTQAKDIWTVLNTTNGLLPMRYQDIAYGDGVYSIVGYISPGGQRTFYSYTGINWFSNITGYTTVRSDSVCFGEGAGGPTFVATTVEGSDTIYTSADGRAWVQRYTGRTYYGAHLAFGQTTKMSKPYFVKVHENKSAAYTVRPEYSVNGLTFQPGTMDGQTAEGYMVSGATDVIFTPDKFVTITKTGKMYTSENAQDWTSFTTNLPANYNRSIAYSEELDLYVSVRESGAGRVAYSTNLTDWTTINEFDGNGWVSVDYGDGLFVAVAKNGTGREIYSVDGIHWTTNGVGEGLPEREYTKVKYVNGDWYVLCEDNALPNNEYVITSKQAGASIATLTFEDSMGLNEFKISDPVKQEDDAALGYANSLNLVDSQMVVVPYNGTWEVGKKVLGT